MASPLAARTATAVTYCDLMAISTRDLARLLAIDETFATTLQEARRLAKAAAAARKGNSPNGQAARRALRRGRSCEA